MTDPSDLPDDWWTTHDCARFVGVEPVTWRSYLARDECPAPDKKIGRSNVWRPARVRHWAAHRPRKPIA